MESNGRVKMNNEFEESERIEINHFFCFLLKLLKEERKRKRYEAALLSKVGNSSDFFKTFKLDILNISLKLRSIGITYYTFFLF